MPLGHMVTVCMKIQYKLKICCLIVLCQDFMVSPVNFVTNATVTTSETQSCMRPVIELEGMNLSR